MGAIIWNKAIAFITRLLSEQKVLLYLNTFPAETAL
jgi:hypothetical protein